jgi:hypothetical protein
MEILFLILEVALLAYLTWILVKLFWHLFCSIKAKDKKSILINSLIFILCVLFFFLVLDPIGHIGSIYQEITKSF